MSPIPSADNNYVQRPEMIERITEATIIEVIETLRLPRWGLLDKLIASLSRKAVSKFGVIADEYDQRIEKEGLAAGTRWFARHFVSDLTIEGMENVPMDGPLLAIANHTGGIDVLAGMAGIPRDDLMIVALEHEMIRRIPHAYEHMLFLQNEQAIQLLTIRSAIRLLDEGKSVFIFPAGRLEPDPEIVPGAIESIRNWSPGVGVFMYKRPQVPLLPIAISGVLSPKAYDLPFARMRSTIVHRQRTALMGQTLINMARPNTYPIHIKVRIGKPITKQELAPNQDAKGTAEAIKQHMIEYLKSLGLDQNG